MAAEHKDDSAVREPEEDRKVEDATGLPARLLYETIRRNGEDELERPLASLFWSGIAAGLLIAFSFVGEAVLRAFLTDTPWRHLIENLGYSLGFLIVILGRMQLFTENTITTVLPVMARPTRETFLRVARLWAVVLGANVIGAFGSGAFLALTAALPAEVEPALLSLAEHAVLIDPANGFVRAIPAGILVAAMVWMSPQANGSEFFVILTFTWLIAAGDFTHIIAGSVEMAYLAVLGAVGPGQAVFGFFLPVLAGNIFGGTAIFALLAWGQVREEVAGDSDG